jgi:hypothetical protein
MIGYLIILFAFLCGPCLAQPPGVQWSREFGYFYMDQEFTTVLQTSDNGYVAAGISTMVPLPAYSWILKTNLSGDSLWSHYINGGEVDVLLSGVQAVDDGYVFAGCIRPYHTSGSWNFWLLRTNEDGDSLWSRTYGGDMDDECYMILNDDDGGFILAGTTQSYSAEWYDDFWMIKVDANGDSVWSKVFGGWWLDVCYSAIRTSDGGYALAGSARATLSGNEDFWIVRTDEDGNELWNRRIGGESADICWSVKQTRDGGFVLAGDTYSYGSGSSDFFVVKLDADGDSLWSRTFGGNLQDQCRAVIESTDGGLLLAGQTASLGTGSYDIWLIKTDTDGDSLWSTTIGDTHGELCNSAVQATDGSYVLAGLATQEVMGSNFLLVKTEPDPDWNAVRSINPIPNSISLAAYPNPFNSELTLYVSGFMHNVRVSLLNVIGQEIEVIHDGVLSGNPIHYSAPATLSSGLYFIRAKDEQHMRTKKVVFLK